MKIYIPEAKEVLVNDSSYCYQGLCEVGQLNATFSLAEFIVFPVGSYCIVEGMRYTLTKPENVTMVHTRNYEYTLLMYDVSYLLDMYKLHNSVDRRLKYEMVAQPQEFIAELVANMNERGDEQWAVGDCLTGVEHLLAFSHNSIREALQMIADAWKTEWSVGMITDHAGDTTYRLNLKKIECNKGTTNGVADAPVLSYGKGKGFLSGVKRDNDSSSQEIFRMYVQGGERNIDRSKYISPYLLLPVNAQYKHEDRTYEVSTDRYYIYNVSKGDKGYEATFDCADVYPSRVGVVSGVEQDKEFYNIVDKDIALTLNYEKCKMAGEKMSVIFQSGMLAGREFDVSKYEQIRNASGQYFGGRFLLCQQDSDGVNMPSGAFVPAVGDKYVVFGIKMPDEYICKDNPHMVGTKAINGIGAEWELLKGACRNMYENEYQKYTFSGELDSIYLRDKWFNIGFKIVVGGYILFTAPFTKEGGELIRITGVKRYINDPYKIELTLSNGMASTSFGTTIDRIETEPIITASGNKSTLRYARRRFADAQETAKMLEASLLDKFTNGITPITVQTMQLLVGSEQLQFAFYEDVEEENKVDLPVVWDKTKKTFTVKCAGLFAFYSTQSKELTPNKPTYMWRLTNDFAKTLGDDVAKNGYYLYLIGREIGGDVQDDEAVFFLTTSPIPYSNANGYALLVGILNSEYDGERSFAPMHGFTEILPGRVTTDKVVSSDGLSYFDMRNNAMQLFKKGKNARLSWDKGELEIVGRIRQMSGDGATYEIGVFKGDYNPNTTYYRGDDVLFSYAGAISTYRFIGNTPMADIPPVGREDSRLFWKIVAMGANGANGIPGVDGKDGKDVEFIYTRTDDDAPPDAFEEPTDKTMDDYIPAGWTDNPTGVNSEYGWEWVCKRIKVNGLWGAFSAPALWAKYSRNGQQGAQGAPIVYRGKYVATETYYGAPYRLDVVKYNDMYFVTRNNAGEFRGVAPTDVNKWNTFGAQFSSVATGLLIADMANIAGWNFFNDIIKSQNGVVQLDGNNNNISVDKQIYLDENGLSLYQDRLRKSLRAQISLNDIDEQDILGVTTQEYTPVTLNSQKFTGVPIWGVGSGDQQDLDKQTGNLFTQSYSVPARTVTTLKAFKASLQLTFNNNSYAGAAFATRHMRVHVILNEENRDNQYFEEPITLNKGTTYKTIDFDFGDVQSKASLLSTMLTLAIKVQLVDMSGTGHTTCDCEVIVRCDRIVCETDSDIKTLIAPNGFYCYTGQQNLLWVTPKDLLIRGKAPTIASGNYALRATENGFEKCTNYQLGENRTWTKINLI